MIMWFFTDPTVDGLAEEMHRAISADLDGLIDFNEVKKVCLPLLFNSSTIICLILSMYLILKDLLIGLPLVS